MSSERQLTLDHVGRFSRKPSHIHKLPEDGERQGLAFLESIPVKDDVGSTGCCSESVTIAPDLKRPTSEAA